MNCSRDGGLIANKGTLNTMEDNSTKTEENCEPIKIISKIGILIMIAKATHGIV